MTNIVNENYLKFRGRCKELCDETIAQDPSLKLVRGFYWCPIWNTKEQHWWTVRPDGTIYDPSKKQFPSAGMGTYTEFDGIIECAECSKQVEEGEAYFYSRYAFCSSACCGRFVGVY